MENEKRLIDSVDEAFARYAEHGDILQLFSDVRFAVINAPTVDAVEVVRCKDCKHREDGLCPMESVEQYPWFATKNEGFCSYGERREA